MSENKEPKLTLDGVEYERTGEIRLPKEGEYFMSEYGSVGEAYCDFTQSKHEILRPKSQPVTDKTLPIAGIPVTEPLVEPRSSLLGQGSLEVSWRQAAVFVGERLASVGPEGYYGFTPKEWLDWAMETLNKNQIVPVSDPQMENVDEESDLMYSARVANNKIQSLESELAEAHEQIKTIMTAPNIPPIGYSDPQMEKVSDSSMFTDSSFQCPACGLIGTHFCTGKKHSFSMSDKSYGPTVDSQMEALTQGLQKIAGDKKTIQQLESDAAFFRNEWRQERIKFVDLANKYNELESQLDEANRAISAREDRIIQLTDQVADMDNELQRVSGESADLRHALHEYGQLRIKSESELSEANAKLKVWKDARDAELQMKDEAIEEMGKLRSELEQGKEAYVKKCCECVKLEGELSGSEFNLKEKTTELMHSEASRVEWNEVALKRNAEIIQLTNELAEVKSKLKDRDVEWWQAVCLVDNVDPNPQAVKEYLARENTYHHEDLKSKLEVPESGAARMREALKEVLKYLCTKDEDSRVGLSASMPIEVLDNADKSISTDAGRAYLEEMERVKGEIKALNSELKDWHDECDGFESRIQDLEDCLRNAKDELIQYSQELEWSKNRLLMFDLIKEETVTERKVKVEELRVRREQVQSALTSMESILSKEKTE